MTAAQLHAARMMIPGAFELNASPQRPTRPAASASPIAFRAPIIDDVAHVLAAPAFPATRLRFAAAVLGDVALCLALIYGVAFMPGVVVLSIKAVAELLLGTVGQQ